MNNHAAEVNRRRQIALDNTKHHLTTAHTQDNSQHVERHHAEMAILTERIKEQSKQRKQIRRMTRVTQPRIAVEEIPTEVLGPYELELHD